VVLFREGARCSSACYAAGMRWPAAAFPRGVLSLFQSGADDSAPGGSRLRSLLRPLATSASGRPGRRRRAVACAGIPAQSLRGSHRALSGYARSDRTRSRMNRMRRGRVRLAATSPRGDHFDLDRLFDELNGKYFEGQLQRPHIGWSTRSWRGNSAVTIRGRIRFC